MWEGESRWLCSSLSLLLSGHQFESLMTREGFTLTLISRFHAISWRACKLVCSLTVIKKGKILMHAGMCTNGCMFPHHCVRERCQTRGGQLLRLRSFLPGTDQPPRKRHNPRTEPIHHQNWQAPQQLNLWNPMEMTSQTSWFTANLFLMKSYSLTIMKIKALNGGK